MIACKHTTWLGVSRKDHDFILEASDRARIVLDSLPALDEPPSLTVLVGNHSKSKLLEALGVRTGRSGGRRRHGEIHMFSSPAGACTEWPMLVADGDIPAHNRLTRTLTSQRCHESSAHPLPRDPLLGRAVDIADHIYYRLLFPFADVICFFAADVGGIDHVVHRLAAWLDKGQPSTIQVRPWLLVVVEDGAEDEVFVAFGDLMRAETSLDVMDRFGGIRIVSLAAKPPRSRRRARRRERHWDRLGRELADLSGQTRRVRLGSGCLFSAAHLASLLQRAAAHVTQAPREPFDFIRASRIDNPVASDLEAHLGRFVTCFRSLDTLRSVSIPMIASSFVLDQYPPGMHPFNPRHVFDTLYRDACHHVGRASVLAHQSSSQVILPSGFAGLVEMEMIRLFDEYLRLGSAKTLHQRVMERCREACASLTSDNTCLACLRRRPQFAMPCGHSVCQNCVKVFGSQAEEDPWLFHVDRCFLCLTDAAGMLVRVKPSTASVRVLSIDGGGTRGRAPLEFIQVLQDRVGLPCPVQQNFDVAYGTSSGAIIAFALYVNGWPVEDCIACFASLARLAFQRRPSFRIPLVSSICQFVFSLLVDSRYPARNLEKALRDVFGPRAIMDCSKATEMGAMVGVPVTTIKDVSTCVFTNYNGVGQRDEGIDYHVLRPEKGMSLIALWNVLLCATAAPYYLKPQEIDGLGAFQDGGLTYNNPTSIAIREVGALFPATPEPSLVVSLGTGSTRADGPEMSRVRRFWRDSFLVRVLRALWRFGGSERGCGRLLSAGKDGYFRFDVEFDGRQPPLDSVTGLEEIGAIARETMLESPALERLIRRIRAELFIFELDPDRPFRLVNGAYECVGYIQCRLRARTPAFEALMSQLDQASASFQVGGRALPGGFQERSAIREDGNFCKEVRICTSSRTEPFAVTLMEGRDNACHISGSPFTLHWLVEQQRLDARFGTSDHQKRKREGDYEGGGERRKRPRLR